MNDFAIIPAIDLKDGAVVHASGGIAPLTGRSRPRSGPLTMRSPSPALFSH